MDKKGQSYKISYKNSAGKNILEFTFMNEEELMNYQLGMLANNSIKGLLKCEVVRINGEIRLQFDITSLVPVKKLFERRRFSRKDFFWLLRQNTDLMGRMEQYLLDIERIVFDGTYIFADPQNLELGFIYLPTKDRTQGVNALKDFLLDVIINDIRFNDEPSDNFIQRLIEILKDPEFDTSSLKKYLNEMNKNLVPMQNTRIEGYLPVKEANTQISLQQKDTLKVNEAVKIKKLCYPSKSYFVLYSVIATLVLFCVVLILTGILSPENPDSLLSLFGLLLIGGAVTYLVYSKLFTPDKKVERVIEKQPDRTGLYTGMEYVNKAFSIPIKQHAGAFDESIAQKEAAPTVISDSIPEGSRQGLPKGENRTSETRPSYGYLKTMQTQDKTIILNADNLKLPYLKRMHGNSFEIIILKHFPFMIGRLEGQVDYCVKNPAVGKLHAEIIKTGEGYYISDMNSRNGTMINGERIDPTTETIIKSGDCITLANEEFIFCCSNTD
jgi:pSer/pThr/pTyr-binding forkhead associated (FHA) protein